MRRSGFVGGVAGEIHMSEPQLSQGRTRAQDTQRERTERPAAPLVHRCRRKAVLLHGQTLLLPI